MIEINLLPGKKKKKSAGAGFKFALPDFRGLLTTIKDPWLIAAIVAWALAIGVGGGLFVWDSARSATVSNRLDAVKAEKRRFDVVIAQKRNAEKIRDSLVAQINVIRGIDADRYVWPHVLDQVTKALPPYTWLTSVQTLGAAAPTPGAAAPTLPPTAPPTTAAESAAALRPVLRKGKVQGRMMLPICLSYDHRVVDGADAVRFVNELVQALESFPEKELKR